MSQYMRDGPMDISNSKIANDSVIFDKHIDRKEDDDFQMSTAR